MMLQIFPISGLGAMICFGLLILVVVVLVIAFFLKMLIEFLPATIIAVLVYLFTKSLFLAIVVFLAIAFVLSLVDKIK